MYGKEKRYHSLGDEEARAGSQGLIGFRLPHDYKYNNTKFRANGKKQRLTARDSYVIQEDLQLEIYMLITEIRICNGIQERKFE